MQAMTPREMRLCYPARFSEAYIQEIERAMKGDYIMFDPKDTSIEEDVLMDLGREINAINLANGWNVIRPEEWESPYKVPAILALIHSEVSEALEAFRHNDKVNFAEELADIVIRVLDCSHGMELDLGSEIVKKLARNRERGYRHGGKKL